MNGKRKNLIFQKEGIPRMSIQINNISKSFGTFKALDTINFDIQTGELVALLGPSGSGKTSLLRIIAGLEEATEGAILFEEEDMTHIHTKERKVGFVFQHYALFRHMTVFENIAYGLKVRPRKTSTIQARDCRKGWGIIKASQS